MVIYLGLGVQHNGLLSAALDGGQWAASPTGNFKPGERSFSNKWSSQASLGVVGVKPQSFRRKPSLSLLMEKSDA
jgi:hypothetical protein